jgi:hypothetical protein
MKDQPAQITSSNLTVCYDFDDCEKLPTQQQYNIPPPNMNCFGDPVNSVKVTTISTPLYLKGTISSPAITGDSPPLLSDLGLQLYENGGRTRHGKPRPEQH